MKFKESLADFRRKAMRRGSESSSDAESMQTRGISSFVDRFVETPDDPPATTFFSPFTRNSKKDPVLIDEGYVASVHEETVDSPENIFDDEFSDEKFDSHHIKGWRTFKKFLSFIGPGIMVSVAYMDPGNYSTDIQGGAQFQYKLLFVILLSTIIAIYLQILAIRLGSITGKDLAQSCRAHLPRWISWFIWFLAESAIIATDIAEVAGTAIALKVLLNIPLIAGVFITIADTLLVIAVYGRENGMRALRILEWVVTALLLTVVVCFCVILAKIPKANIGQVFYGYVPSSAIVTSEGIYAAAGILGATVMPHSLYLGSAQTIPRVREHDMKNGYRPRSRDEKTDAYKPSVEAIRATIKYAITETVIALSTVALFINSAILIVAGDTMYGSEEAENADLFSLNDMLKMYLGKGIAIVFFIALLASGLSSSVICTIAGQIVGEGHIKWKTKAWVRRLVTRLISLIPCAVVVGCVGQKGISDAINWSQVVLTITLPFLTMQLVYLTSSKKVMAVNIKNYQNNGKYVTYSEDEKRNDYANGWISTIFGSLVTIFLFVANCYLLVEIGLTN